MKNPFASMIDTIDQVLNKATNKAQTPALVAPHHPKKTQPLAPVPVPAENTLTMQPTAVYGEVVQGQWIDATGQKAVALPQIIVRMEEHRRTAEQFVEDKEDVADKAVRYGVKVLMYVGPVVLAFFVAMLIGEQYGKLSQDFWWKPGMYAIAVVTEGTLWGTSFASSREFRRMLSDRSRAATLITLVVFFLGFSGMSILAQWFVYEGHFTHPDFPTVIGIVFRTCSTTGVDILSLLVLGTLDYQSFAAHLKKQQAVANQVQALSQTEIDTNRKLSEEVLRQGEAEIETKRKLKHAQFFADMESKQIDAMRNGGREDRSRW